MSPEGGEVEKQEDDDSPTAPRRTDYEPTGVAKELGGALCERP